MCSGPHPSDCSGTQADGHSWACAAAPWFLEGGLLSGWPSLAAMVFLLWGHVRLGCQNGTDVLILGVT